MRDEVKAAIATQEAKVNGQKKQQTPVRAAKSKCKEVENQRAAADYPRHSLEKALRIPRAILEQNAGKECGEEESARFSGVGYGGPYKLEISSCIKYGLLERPKPRHVKITDLARKILRPQDPQDEISGRRQAVLRAPDIGEVYKSVSEKGVWRAESRESA